VTRALDATALRLFVTCWVVYGLHFATNVVREHYPAFALAEHGTLRVDPYVGLHPDLFEIPGRGAFINSNPGASMLAAIPYAAVRPIADRIVEGVARARAARGDSLTAEYDDPRPNRRRFFAQVRARGLDVRFGLAALATHALLMAPLTAASAVVMRSLLLRCGFGARASLGLAFLYAFGTPVFFRAAFLNQNLLVSHFGLFAFALLFRPSGADPGPRRLALAGLSAGAAVLCDYSGAVLLGALAAYAVAREAARARRGLGVALARSLPMLAGAAIPIAALAAYQAWAFGHPLWPAQHYMPATPYSRLGADGFSAPQLDLLAQNLVDPRFGLFAFCPLLVLGLAAPWGARTRRHLPSAELALALGVFVGILLFSSGNQFGRLQWNTGVRYMVPAVPLLFLATADVWSRLPRGPALVLAVVTTAESWCLAMARESVPESIAAVLRGGLQLPWLTVLSKMGGQYVKRFEAAPPDPTLPLLGIAALLVLLWRLPRRARPGAQARP
jgi:hypothetical protein